MLPTSVPLPSLLGKAAKLFDLICNELSGCSLTSRRSFHRRLQGRRSRSAPRRVVRDHVTGHVGQKDRPGGDGGDGRKAGFFWEVLFEISRKKHRSRNKQHNKRSANAKRKCKRQAEIGANRLAKAEVPALRNVEWLCSNTSSRRPPAAAIVPWTDLWPSLHWPGLWFSLRFP